jgi:hypothetical protein
MQLAPLLYLRDGFFVMHTTNTSILNLQFLDMHGWEDVKDLVFLHSFHIKERESYGIIMLMSSFILTESLRSPVQAMIL